MSEDRVLRYAANAAYFFGCMSLASSVALIALGKYERSFAVQDGLVIVCILLIWLLERKRTAA